MQSTPRTADIFLRVEGIDAFTGPSLSFMRDSLECAGVDVYGEATRLIEAEDAARADVVAVLRDMAREQLELADRHGWRIVRELGVRYDAAADKVEDDANEGEV